MKFEKLEIEVVSFDDIEFMAGSMVNGHCSGYSENGESCGDYTERQHCSNYSWSGGTCDDVDHVYRNLASCDGYSGDSWAYICFTVIFCTSF